MARLGKVRRLSGGVFAPARCAGLRYAAPRQALLQKEKYTNSESDGRREGPDARVSRGLSDYASALGHKWSLDPRSMSYISTVMLVVFTPNFT